MAISSSIPWSRIFVEAGAIVISILLAFSIDTWWDQRQDRESEQIALISLLSDFRSSRGELESRLQYLESAREAFRDFVSATPDELERLPDTTVAEIPTLLGTSATFEPNLTTLEAITADGRLGLLRNVEVRELLSRWRKKVGDSQEDTMRVLSSSFRVGTAMEPFGGPFLSPRLEATGAPASDIFPSATPLVVAELRRSPSFVGVARSHQVVVSYYVSELRGSLALLDELMSALEANIQQE